jgi:hypothetical protein
VVIDLGGGGGGGGLPPWRRRRHLRQKGEREELAGMGVGMRWGADAGRNSLGEELARGGV